MTGQDGDVVQTYERELTVERAGVGSWAIYDSAVGDWETIGKEGDAIKEARSRAKDSGVPSIMRVIGTGADRPVKYQREYNMKPPATSTPKASPSGPTPPPLPGEDTADPEVPAGTYEPPAPVPATTPVETPSRDDGAYGEDLKGPLFPAAQAAAGLTINVARLPHLILFDDGLSGVAVDPVGRMVVVPKENGTCEIHCGAYGLPVLVKGSLLDVVATINRGRD